MASNSSCKSEKKACHMDRNSSSPHFGAFCFFKKCLNLMSYVEMHIETLNDSCHKILLF